MNVLKVILLVLVVMLQSCKTERLTRQEREEKVSNPEYFHKALDKLTDVIVHDIFSPPVASRVYVYPCVAAYEVARLGNSNYSSLSGQLAGLKSIPTPTDTANISYNLAAILAFIEVGQALIFSEDKMESFKTEYIAQVDSIGVPKTVVEASHQYAVQVKNHILQWADKDNYKETRSYPKFTLSSEPARWKPTPPSYMEGIEPHWREIRTMVLDSAEQFVPNPPPAYDLDKNSDFFKYLMEVYTVGKSQTQEQRAIASFWDCNPFVMNQTGHIMYATKKITPGGHWMGIAAIASRNAKADLMESINASTWVSIGLFDAFISCWDEKYRSNLTRPETVINEHIDPKWVPTLQTPPFPEHTSGHSVISTASAVILTQLFGDDFSFTDDVEVKYGLPERSFKSFLEASQEAAISRLYGGIHYMPAIEDGVEQGRNVGQFICKNLSTQS